MITLLWVVAAATAAPAPAGPAPDPILDVSAEADHQFRLGNRDYEAGRYDDALGHLLASMRLVPNANVAFNVAACFEQLGRPELAWQYYHDYAARASDPAEGKSALERLSPEVARVSVTSDPPGAVVYVGRVDLGAHGVTPLVLGLPPGPTTLLATYDGRSAETRIELVKGVEVAAKLTLPPPPPPPPQPAPVVPAPAPEPPFWALLHVGDDVIARVDRDRCELVPPFLQSGTRAAAAPTPRGPAPGSVGLATVPTTELVLDVRLGNGALARTVLTPVERHAMVLDDTAALREWVFERCVVTDANALGVALAKVPIGLRGTVATVFAEWAAARGAADGGLALRCVQGDCRGLAQAVAGG